MNSCVITPIPVTNERTVSIGTQHQQRKDLASGYLGDGVRPSEFPLQKGTRLQSRQSRGKRGTTRQKKNRYSVHVKREANTRARCRGGGEGLCKSLMGGKYVGVT